MKEILDLMKPEEIEEYELNRHVVFYRDDYDKITEIKSIYYVIKKVEEGLDLLKYSDLNIDKKEIKKEIERINLIKCKLSIKLIPEIISMYSELRIINNDISNLGDNLTRLENTSIKKINTLENRLLVMYIILILSMILFLFIL